MLLSFYSLTERTHQLAPHQLSRKGHPPRSPLNIRLRSRSISSTPLFFKARGPSSENVQPSGKYPSLSSPGSFRPRRRVIQDLGPQRRHAVGLTYHGKERYSTELYRPVLLSGVKGMYRFRMNSGRGGARYRRRSPRMARTPFKKIS